ncbi:polyketide synthase [Acrasis kona]|uniref:Polyketide synthase n=1 Tax=Acrasis kona TaxID=1008807 RepID=A0AAW2ZIE2_9EUKA
MDYGTVTLERIKNLDRNTICDITNPSQRNYSSEAKYPSFPTLTKKQRENTDFWQKVASMKKAVDEQYQSEGAVRQFDRDAKLWRMTLKFAGNVHRLNVLRRICVVLRHGGLMVKNESLPSVDEFGNPQTQFVNWYEKGWPIACALSHGGRFLIQLNKLPPDVPDDYRDHSFWNWLLTGKEDGDSRTVLSLLSSGDEAEQEGKIIFKRIGATHEIVYGDKEELLCDGKKQHIFEARQIGVTLRNTKLFKNIEATYTHHRHWGLNIPMGGHGCESLVGELVSANGEHGHIYIYYQSPANRRNGGILIGVEGSEFNKYDQGGHIHSIRADSSDTSPTYGYKWYNSKGRNPDGTVKNDGLVRDLISSGGPPKFNGIVVDLSDGWSKIKEQESEWKDDFVMYTSEIPDNTNRKERRKIRTMALSKRISLEVPNVTDDNNNVKV